jgi:hypothetical protein
MTTTINASTSSGLVVTPDNSGNVLLQYNGMAAPTFSAYMANGSSNQTLAAGAYTKVKIDTENWDTNSNFDTSTYRFTPTVAGYYSISGGVFINYGSTSPHNCAVLIYKNGAAYRQNYYLNNSGDFYGAMSIYSLIYFNGSTDYVELYAFQNNSGDAFIAPYSSAPSATWFDGCLLRGA